MELSKELGDLSLDDLHLAHYGVKGMHWGIRNDREPKSAQEKAVDSHYRKRRAKIAAAFTAYGAAATAGIAYVNKMFVGGTYKQSLRALVSDPKNMALIWGGTAFGAVIRDQFGAGSRRYTNN